MPYSEGGEAARAGAANENFCKRLCRRAGTSSVLLREGGLQGCGECRTAREAKPPERAQRMRTSVSAPAGEPAPAACC
ncbi:MAG TPA: hypothetical protein DF667_04670 [Roseburia sp.]|nr:hypothetical protein [Roseburia sp.]